MKKNNRFIYLLGTLKHRPRYLTYIFLIQLSHNKRKRHILDCTAATNGKSEILGGGRRGQILMLHNLPLPTPGWNRVNSSAGIWLGKYFPIFEIYFFRIFVGFCGNFFRKCSNFWYFQYYGSTKNLNYTVLIPWGDSLRTT